MQLIPGTTYSFKVNGRNIIGISDNSTVLNVLAASKPDPPSVTTINN
jgi:hypothetical protein